MSIFQENVVLTAPAEPADVAAAKTPSSEFSRTLQFLVSTYSDKNKVVEWLAFLESPHGGAVCNTSDEHRGLVTGMASWMQTQNSIRYPRKEIEILYKNKRALSDGYLVYTREPFSSQDSIPIVLLRGGIDTPLLETLDRGLISVIFSDLVAIAKHYKIADNSTYYVSKEPLPNVQPTAPTQPDSQKTNDGVGSRD